MISHALIIWDLYLSYLPSAGSECNLEVMDNLEHPPLSLPYSNYTIKCRSSWDKITQELSCVTQCDWIQPQLPHFTGISAANVSIRMYFFSLTLSKEKNNFHVHTPALLFRKLQKTSFIQMVIFSHCEWQVNRHWLSIIVSAPWICAGL